MEIPYTITAQSVTAIYDRRVAAAVPSGGAFFGWPGQLVVRVDEGHRRQSKN